MKINYKEMVFTHFLMAMVLLLPFPSYGRMRLKASIERLNSISEKIPREITEIDKTLLAAVEIIEKMEEVEMWKEVGRIVNTKEFVYSKYYDELLYLYLAHLANEKNYYRINSLWEKMGTIQDSVHLFPAMLIRLFAFKSEKSTYSSELSKIMEYIDNVPDTTIIHGPYIQGSFLFGYFVKEDYSEGPLPVTYTIKNYKESPKPLEGFSNDTQYIGLLQEWERLFGIHPEYTSQLADLYSRGGEKKEASKAYYRIANFYYEKGEYELANEYIKKSLTLNSTYEEAIALKKKIDLEITLRGHKIETQERIEKAVKEGKECDDTYLIPPGKRLSLYELKNKSIYDLRIMRNEIFAKHGRAFQSPDLHAYFTKKCWYKINPDYSDDLLDETDRYNLLLIQQVESQKR
jgi:tetratricopeptide (TPR) repeat protein